MRVSHRRAFNAGDAQEERMAGWDDVRRIALALPEVRESTWYGTAAFKVRDKGFARLKEDGENMVLRCNLFERKFLLEDFPAVFHITDHYRDYPAVLVRLAAVSEEQLRERVEASWRTQAPARVVEAYDRGQG
jgi:hypothetical protein